MIFLNLPSYLDIHKKSILVPPAWVVSGEFIFNFEPEINHAFITIINLKFFADEYAKGNDYWELSKYIENKNTILCGLAEYYVKFPVILEEMECYTFQ